jgi:hypothetical protein
MPDGFPGIVAGSVSAALVRGGRGLRCSVREFAPAFIAKSASRSQHDDGNSAQITSLRLALSAFALCQAFQRRASSGENSCIGFLPRQP